MFLLWLLLVAVASFYAGSVMASDSWFPWKRR